MSVWIIAPLCIVALIVVAVAALFIGSIIIVGIAEAMR
jgi:hypothetical protein